MGTVHPPHGQYCGITKPRHACMMHSAAMHACMVDSCLPGQPAAVQHALESEWLLVMFRLIGCGRGPLNSDRFVYRCSLPHFTASLSTPKKCIRRDPTYPHVALEYTAFCVPAMHPAGRSLTRIRSVIIMIY